MKKQILLMMLFMVIAICSFSGNNNEVKACYSKTKPLASFTFFKEMKKNMKPAIKELKKEKDESYLLFLNPFIKI